jgi:uncharacterized protein
MNRLATVGSLADRIAEHVRRDGGGAGPAERRSWSRSLAVLAQDLEDAGLDRVEVLVEYKLPLTSKRVDAVLAGVHPKTGHDSYLVVELKQWSHAKLYDTADSLVSVEHAHGPRLHPAVQVASYCEYLSGFLSILSEEGATLRGSAYLHNAIDSDISGLFLTPPTDHGRIFTKERRGEFLEYLRGHLAPESGAGAADRFLGSSVRPSRQLLTHAAEELQQRSQFTLLDEQRVAYDLVFHAVERARTSDHKRVVIVEGGPGSGKSVIALSVLAELARRGRPALHATGSRSFTQTMRRYAGRGSTRLKGLFRYFNSFGDYERNGLDVLICDEAHRIRETSVNRFTSKAVRAKARPQIDELISASRVPVFLLDEHQVVKPGELGSVEVITSWAQRAGVEVETISLYAQYRCGGSDAYERWLLALLGLGDDEPYVWKGDGRFDLQIAESPEQMEAFLRRKQSAGETARISAGYCWRWSDPLPDGTLVPDVKIQSWARPWNVKGERAVSEAPPSAFWATDPRGFGQVGCIYTAQGFEYEWSGVIIGPDLVARDGLLVSRRSESADPAFRRAKRSLSDTEADQLIRNTYKVLMTRGMRGTMVYSTDAETREYLAKLIRPGRPVETRYEPIAPGAYERRDHRRP